MILLPAASALSMLWMTIFYTDDRIAVSRSPGSEFSAFGAVRHMASGSTTTGVLVGKCEVLTVRHILDDDQLPDEKGRFGFRVAFGTGDEKPYGTVLEAEPVKWGEWEDYLLLRVRQEDCRYLTKYGTVRLETTSGHSLNYDANWWKKVAPNVIKVGQPRDKDRAAGLWIDPKCSIHSMPGDFIIKHDCAVLKGDSGGGLVERDGKGIKLICLQMRGSDADDISPEYNESFANDCFLASYFYEQIEPFLTK